MLCASCERGTRPVPCSPLGRTGTSGWKWQGSEFGYHVGSVFQSWVPLGIGPSCLWDFSLEVSNQRWEKGSHEATSSVEWRGLKLVLHPMFRWAWGLLTPLQGLLWGWRGNHPAGVLCPPPDNYSSSISVLYSGILQVVYFGRRAGDTFHWC